HLLAHSLYKAHAFLASGSVVDRARAAGAPAPGTPPHPAILGSALLLGVVITVAVAACFGESLLQSPGVFALGAVMMMGLAQLLSAALGAHPGWPAAARGLGVAVLVAVAYFALQRGAAWLCAGAVPAPQPLRGPFDFAVAALVVLSLGAVMLLQSLLPARAGSRRWQAAYVHLLNGLYLGRLADRILLHLWPLPASGARI
ncbi:MAG: hypothetical protein M0Z28_03260, partial [Rhodospirillales bacterium]|nr:hypothetical protein [Rhodospirillales bacterium]